MRKFALALAALFLATSAHAQVAYPPILPDFTGMATQSQLSAIAATVPTPSVTAPPCIADAGSLGSGSGIYALANHTHCSKARRGIVTTDAAGLVTVTFGTAFGAGVVPACMAIAAPAAGVTDVINAQLDGDPTNTGVVIRVTRTQKSVVALISLTVLSIPATVGATKVHYICIEP